MSVVEALPTWDDTDTDELILRRAALEADILEIVAQLKDKTRHGRLGSLAYYRWKGDAQFALNAKRGEVKVIKAVLSKRRKRFEKAQRKAREERRAIALANPNYVISPPEEMEQHRADNLRKRAEMVATLQQPDGADALLLRTFRVFAHLKGPSDPLPEAIDAADREALHALALYLRTRFGKESVRDFIHNNVAEVAS